MWLPFGSGQSLLKTANLDGRLSYKSICSLVEKRRVFFAGWSALENLPPSTSGQSGSLRRFQGDVDRIRRTQNLHTFAVCAGIIFFDVIAHCNSTQTDSYQLTLI